MLGANPQDPRSAYAESWGFRCGRHGLKSGCRGQILAIFHLLAPIAVVFKIQKYVRIPLSRGGGLSSARRRPARTAGGKGADPD